MAILNVVALLSGTAVVVMNSNYTRQVEAVEAESALSEPQDTAIKVQIVDTGLTQLDEPHTPLHLYEVKYDITTVNRSRRKVTVTYDVMKVYRGSPSRSGFNNAATLLNEPPPLWPQQIDRESGPINWSQVICLRAIQSVSTDLAHTSGVKIANEENVRKFLGGSCSDPPSQAGVQAGLPPLERGGGLTGIFPGGALSYYGPELYVWAHPGDYLGTIVGYGLDGDVDIADENVSVLQDVRPIVAGREGPTSAVVRSHRETAIGRRSRRRESASGSLG